MLNLGKNHDKLTVVCRSDRKSTYTYDLARLLVDMIGNREVRALSCDKRGICSWYEFACEIFRQAAAMGRSEYDAEHLTVGAGHCRSIPF